MTRDAHRSDHNLLILGAGAWGTALAATAVRGAGAATLWGRNSAQLTQIEQMQQNARYLPGIDLPEGIATTTDLDTAAQAATSVIVATPSGSLNQICAQLAPVLPQGCPVVLAAKGLDRATGAPLPEAAEHALPNHPIGILSGPSFATETARGLPTAVTLAFAPRHEQIAFDLAHLLASDCFRPYVSTDPTGVALCGAIKNVLAIAAGMVRGAGFAENTRAALISRGINEMTRLLAACGGAPETAMGLAGLGDLTLTCGSETSRNMSLGLQLGQGTPRAQCFGGRAVTVEGEGTAATLARLAADKGLDLPICAAVHAILHEGADMHDSFARLWARPLKRDHAVSAPE